MGTEEEATTGTDEPAPALCRHSSLDDFAWDTAASGEHVTISACGRQATLRNMWCDRQAVGVCVLDSARFSITYKVLSSWNSNGGGLLLGVKDATGDCRGTSAGRAWGLNMFNGKLVLSRDGAAYSETAEESAWARSGSSSGNITGCQVTVHVDTEQQSMVFAMTRGGAGEPETVHANISDFPGGASTPLPTELRPWCFFGRYESDCVELVDIRSVATLAITVDCRQNELGSCLLSFSTADGTECASEEIMDPLVQSIGGHVPHDLVHMHRGSVVFLSSAGAILSAEDMDRPIAQVLLGDLG